MPDTPPFVTSSLFKASVDLTVTLPFAGLGDEPVAGFCDEAHDEASTATTSPIATSGGAKRFLKNTSSAAGLPSDTR